MKFFADIIALDKRLAAARFPPLSAFWRESLERFYLSDSRRLVARVGRRGGKGLTLSKLAVAHALLAPWSVPPGELAVVSFSSVDRQEASARLRTIAAMLDALHEKYDKRAEEIELRSRPVVFRVSTASLSGVVGFTSPFIACDEVARWRKDSESSANPAREVIASLTPTMISQPTARMLICSSPWSTQDYFSELCEQGDDETQIFVEAPTWIANPTLSEKETHKLERDPRVHAREYGARPSDAVQGIIGKDELRAIVSPGVKQRPPVKGTQYLVFLDVGLREDYTAILVAHRALREKGDGIVDVLVVDAIKVLKPSAFSALGVGRVKIDDVIEETIALVKQYGARAVWCDRHYIDAIKPALNERKVVVKEASMAAPDQAIRITTLMARITGETLALIDNEELKKELLQAQLIHHPGGRLTLSAPERKGAHDDVLDCLLLACDPLTVAKLPAGADDVVVTYTPLHMGEGPGDLHGGEARYYRRDRAGTLTPREPPYGSWQYDQWAEQMRARGESTPSMQRWAAERRKENEEIE